MSARVPRQYDAELASRNSALVCSEDEDKVQQQFKDDADINVIVERAGITGTVIVARTAPMYGDFSAVADFQSAMEQLRRAEDAFGQLPAELREDYGHDPARFADWVTDPANREKAVAKGLLVPPAGTPRGTVAPDAPPPSDGVLEPSTGDAGAPPA